MVIFLSEWNFHAHTTMLLIWTFLSMCTHFYWIKCAQCLCQGDFCGNNSLSVCVISVCVSLWVYAIFYTLICQLRGKSEETRFLFSVCDAHIYNCPHRDGKTNNTKNLIRIPTKAKESVSFDLVRQTPFNWCRFAWHFMDVRSGVQNIKLRFVQQVKSIRFIFIQFEVKS